MNENTKCHFLYLVGHMTVLITKVISLPEEPADFFLWVWSLFDVDGTGQVWCREQCSHATSLQSCPTLQPHAFGPRGSFVRGVLQARILEWVAILFSRGSPWPRDWTQVSCIAGRFFNTETPGKPYYQPSLWKTCQLFSHQYANRILVFHLPYFQIL